VGPKRLTPGLPGTGERDMKQGNQEISAMVATMREMNAKSTLNSSEILLGKIIVHTLMTVSHPDMLSEGELVDMNTFVNKIGLTPDDLIRMAARIMAERLVQKMEDHGMLPYQQ
jgi:hypothetical protein